MKTRCIICITLRYFFRVANNCENGGKFKIPLSLFSRFNDTREGKKNKKRKFLSLRLTWNDANDPETKEGSCCFLPRKSSPRRGCLISLRTTRFNHVRRWGTTLSLSFSLSSCSLIREEKINSWRKKERKGKEKTTTEKWERITQSNLYLFPLTWFRIISQKIYICIQFYLSRIVSRTFRLMNGMNFSRREKQNRMKRRKRKKKKKSRIRISKNEFASTNLKRRFDRVNLDRPILKHDSFQSVGSEYLLIQTWQ